ncbi:AfsR/SARP family transcriptional regulator [Geodermatophilus sp. DSM 45219]|uniref:AfsR/SARP family transcriptional regulator n=1 Tax=Geodermatophilus sp. DSM 45219 TaxID=1881103 RepID=UPI000881B3AA|nr:AfsR/SARP family transcriptional regulator [Geodermatophilus sp. DSM 45219]SDO45635.1 Transcriptional regulatory protein, C terminal [Geodermatophilus sp. DSM 45219]
MVVFGVLGPLQAEDGGRLLDLRGPRHREVLARLLVARGRVVSVARLVDDLWDDPPAGAVGAVQTFVGALRRALEPDRPPRTPPRLLVTAAPGYALRVAPEDTDAGRFETAVDAAGALLAGGRPAEAHAALDGALALWRGAAYAEVAGAAWARAETARLEELRLVALERRAEAAIALGRAATAVAELEALVATAPLREEVWRLLALGLYRSGRQGDALAQLRRARDVLRAEAGIDPGPALRQLQADVLAQAPHLVPRPAVPPPAPVLDPGAGVVGRADELAGLLRTAAEVRTSGAPRLVLLSGVAGAGKTTLARLLADRLRADGWAAGWGASPEVPGAPAAWPWAQVAGQLDLPVPGDGAEDPAAARFARARALPAALAGRGPALVVLDDLHRADEETLALLTTLAADPAAGPVLLVGTYRSTEVAAPLAAALGRAARSAPHRVYLGGLTADQVGELVRVLTHRAMPADQARAVHRRSGGNPFFVRELVRLWEDGGEAALATVPAGVRDVLRARLAALPAEARTHLRQAAVLGPEPDVELLAALAGDEDAVLGSVEAALLAGFLEEAGADRLRFSHALVQETLYADVPGPRRARWHAAAGRWLAGSRPGDVEAVAHHLVAAGERANPAEVAAAARAAAERAERRTAVSAAARLWQAVLDALDRAGGGDARERLVALTGLVRTLAVGGRLDLARQHRAAAVEVAEAVGDPVLTARVLGAFDVPAVWTTNDDEALSAHLVAVAERALAGLPPGHAAERARLLATVAMERRADPGPRGGAAAREAERIARRLGDRRLLAVALDGRFLQTFGRAGLAPERAAVGEQLVELAAGSPGLVPFEVLGHLVTLQARAALADLDAADRSAAAVDALAREHDLPLAGAFTGGYAALRLAVAGRGDEAAAAYRAAAARLRGTGMTGVEEGLLPLALACLDAPDVVAPGRVDPAPGHLYEARGCLAALAAVRSGDRRAAERLYTDLLPAAGELAAGSGLVCPGPVALYLGLLAGALGRRDDAAAHLSAAAALADRIGAPHWAAAARRARR